MRDPGGRSGGTPVETGIVMLARAVERLAQRVQRIEASNRTMPPDTVFEHEEVDGRLFVFVRRVSTDERWQVVPPPVTEESMNAAIADAIAALPPP